MLERLKTTFQQINKTEEEIQVLQKGKSNSKSPRSQKNVENSHINRKLTAILNTSNSQNNVGIQDKYDSKLNSHFNGQAIDKY